MKTSQKGLDLIKKFEGLRLKAYKPVPSERYWTIGYGHYGADVKEGMHITEQQATEYLKKDLQTAENAVNNLNLKINQNQFDALVSFTYNCGAGNLQKLCLGRTVEQIGNKLTLYTKAGGKTLSGLVRRRNEEQALYKEPVNEGFAEKQEEKVDVSPIVEKKKEEPVKTIQNEKKPEEKPVVNKEKKVKISITNLNIRKGPSKKYDRTGAFTGVGVFTIVETRNGEGSKKGWGKLKSGAGWVSLDFCKELK